MTISPFRTAVAAVLVGAGLQTGSLASARILAHHSFAAEFDENKPVNVTGKVTSMRWSNPHAWIYVDVTGADGKVVNWAFETSAVNSLYRRGWRKEDLPTGGPHHRRLAGAQHSTATPTAPRFPTENVCSPAPAGTAGTHTPAPK
jgi:hypothetical protein